ncbi:MAG: hypothetical protein QM571_07335, partial [Micrococcaceae bacterium]
GISVDASDDIKNFTITAVLDGCDSVTAEQVWIYPNLMTVGNNHAGDNNGQYTLGNGTLTDTNTFGAIGPYKVWTQVGGRWHGLALSEGNELWDWGGNAYGQVGNGNRVSQSKPVQIANSWNVISDGWGHSLGITTGELLYSWGYNHQGQLGNGSSGSANSYDVLTPTRIAAGTLASVRWSYVSGGHTHSLALDTDQKLYAFGSNTFGQLAAGTGTSSYLNPTLRYSSWSWLDVAAGRFYSLGVRDTGALYSWGVNDNYQLGRTPRADDNSLWAATQVGTATNWTQVSGQFGSSFAINSDGELWAWGQNNLGQLGLGYVTSSTAAPWGVPSPKQVVVSGVQWAYVSSGANQTMALSTDGDLYGWGHNADGDLGLGNNDSPVLTPTKIGKLKWDTAESAVSAGIGVARTFVPQGYSY